MNNKIENHFANEIVTFFKVMKVSVFIGLVVSCGLFFGIYEGHEYINPKIDITIINHNHYSREVIGMEERYKKALDYSYGYDWNSHLFMHPESLVEDSIKRSCKEYLNDKLILSLLIGLIVFLGVPVLVVLSHITSRAMKQSRQWVDKNRTI
jgi:hypothetical protein